ncbi:MAG TPA: TRAP transporter large permease subunit, partial [Rhodopila sp.]|nr:TRAP transporter large permease subunit [Rhodopila sp.]
MARSLGPGMARSAGRIATRLDLLLRIVAEVPAAILVVAEVVVLFTGVMARYVFHAPLVWTDELASILFLWLAMLGSVIALQRSEHMRLTAVVGGMSAAGRARTEALASAAVAVFLLMVVPSAWDYASDQWFIETPALGIHDTFRAMAILVGGVLMVVTAVTRLLRLSWADALFGVALVVGLAVVLHFAAPWLKGFGNWNLVLFFVVLLGAGVLLSVPIGFAFGLATLAYLATLTRTPLTVVVSRIDEGMSSLILLAVPLFVFLGLLIEMTGMAKAMVGFLAALLGHVRGGLSYVLLGAMYLVSGISGSKAADMAAVAPVLFPDMKRRGANEGELVSLLSASGAMSET